MYPVLLDHCAAHEKPELDAPALAAAPSPPGPLASLAHRERIENKPRPESSPRRGEFDANTPGFWKLFLSPSARHLVCPAGCAPMKSLKAAAVVSRSSTQLMHIGSTACTSPRPIRWLSRHSRSSGSAACVGTRVGSELFRPTRVSRIGRAHCPARKAAAPSSTPLHSRDRPSIS
jgi:hypothetical protein